jgi:hypothetical protein
METEIVKPSLEMEIQGHFLEFERKASSWMKKAKTIKVTDATQQKEMEQAREARLELKKIRIAIDGKHRELKEESLRTGQTLDKIKRTLTGLIEPIEDYLLEQEKFVETQEIKRKEELFKTRIASLLPFIPEHEAKAFPLGSMSEEAFGNMLNGYKLQFEHNEREAARQKRLREEQQLRDEAERKHLAAENEKLRKEKEQQESKLKKEREERQKLEREAEAKRLAEENDRKEEQARKRKAARAPDREKLLVLASRIEEMEFSPVSGKLVDGDAQKILDNALGLLVKTRNYITTNAEKL